MNTTRTHLIILCLTLSSLIWLSSCGEDEVITLSKLISVTAEPPGDNCRFGGIRIATGVDDNDDGILSEEEIDEVQYVCENPNQLVSVNQESPGQNCATGGIRIETGQDADNDGLLDEDEIDQVQFICNNPQGLVRTQEEAPGANCANGGIAIMEGLDADGDGNLSNEEISSVQYVCNSSNTLIETSQENPGANCANGGVRVITGTDSNGDQVLSADEIVSTEYFCNAVASIVSTSDEPAGLNCPSGGIRIDIGTDDNANGTLDSNEIDQTQYVCNGSGGIGGGDLLVRLEIGSIGANNHSIHTNNTSFIEYGPDRDRLTNFSKLDYPGVDSIVYVVPMRSTSSAFNCFVELYDGTNGSSIVTLQSNHSHADGIYQTVYSGNIYDLLPSDGTRIDLANRIASEEFGNYVYAGLPAQLLLFRRD